jgi:hypothetical protein
MFGRSTPDRGLTRGTSLQQFSDDEDEADEPLAPLPDEPEVPEVEGDEDMDQDELALPGSVQEAASVASFEPTGPPPKEENEAEDTPSKPPTPKRHPLSISFQPSSEAEPDDVLDESLAVGVGVTVVGVGIGGLDDDNGGVVDMDVLDISALDPNGTAFEAAHDLQMEPSDALMSGVLMGQSDDPFADALGA